jgi:riboflavin kinase/FMN adenylyltransferase
VSHLGTLSIEEGRVSSSRIREALAAGDFATAEALLGYRYFVTGHVVYGRQLGRQLDIPTANLRLGRYRSPLTGVFVVEVDVDGQRHRGIANVGVRPTIGGTEPLVEAHLFDFVGDLYGKLITVTFRHRIRDEQAFPGLDALKAQIARDSDFARAWHAAEAARGDARSLT